MSLKPIIPPGLYESSSGGDLPDQTGHAGEFLTTDGTDADWAPLAGGGDVVASGTLTNNAIALGGGGTTVKTTATGTGIVTALGVDVGSAGAPVLFNGAGGTPSSLVGTNITGTAAGLTAGVASAVAVGGITGLGTGVATALAVNVGTAGAPVVLNGAGGTPSSMTATNLTGTAAGLTAGAASAVAVGGITGLGTGVATALAVNVGTAGAPVVQNGALGTPSSGTLSGCTGLKVAVKQTASNYTVGTTDPNELFGGIIYVTGACTITIPAVAAGANFTVATVGAVAVSVDPNAADLIVRDGTAQADGEMITNLSTAGDIAVFTYYDATGWYAATNAWTNGG